MQDQPDEHEAFDAFVRDVEPRLRRALMVTYGAQDGRESAAAALAWAWEHWPKVAEMDEPVGYLYRVGQSARRQPKPPPLAAPEAHTDPDGFEPNLGPALAALPERQRVAVVLVHGFQWRLVEVADLLGVSESTVRNHLARGMASVRRSLEVTTDA